MKGVDPRTPVVVGIGQVTNRRERLVEPLGLAAEAAALALADSGGRLHGGVDTIAFVNVLTPAGDQPAHRLAARLGLAPRRHLGTTIGGNTPQWLVGQLARDIATGASDVALIVGAEATDSAKRATAAGEALDHVREASPSGEDDVVGDPRIGVSDAEARARLVAPAALYPLFESVLAARAGRTLEEQRVWLGSFMQPATAVAARHPDLAWFPQVRTAAELSTPSPENRMISEPYTKLLNAIIQVDQSAALLMCSVAVAEAAGISSERWVFPLGVADLNDVFFPAQRPDLAASPAIATAAGALFEAVGCGIDDVSAFDLYSCFPCAVEIASNALRLPFDDDRGFTVTGGHPYFGGPGNNYTTHSIAAMIERCREQPGSIGLTTGLGWYITKHSIGLWSTTPPQRGFPRIDLRSEQAAIDATAVPLAEIDAVTGRARVEAFSVLHDRDEGPIAIPVVASMEDGTRVVARIDDPAFARAVSGMMLVGAEIKVRPQPGGAPQFELA